MIFWHYIRLQNGLEIMLLQVMEARILKYTPIEQVHTPVATIHLGMSKKRSLTLAGGDPIERLKKHMISIGIWSEKT